MTIEFEAPRNNEDRKYTPLPEGRYTLQVEKASLSTSKEGNPTIKVEYSVLDAKHRGRKVFRTFSLTSKAIWALQEFAGAAGVDIAKTGGKIEEQDLVDDLNLRNPAVSAFNDPGDFDNFKLFQTASSDLPSFKATSKVPSSDIW